ncbi:MAG TPA: hypothetical protein VNZ52_15675 [Candidatus Thermoplasmatota archaeon]|nr:hypothetical protein [Candidatus Thermoplasmatota archaeon]
MLLDVMRLAPPSVGEVLDHVGAEVPAKGIEEFTESLGAIRSSYDLSLLVGPFLDGVERPIPCVLGVAWVQTILNHLLDCIISPLCNHEALGLRSGQRHTRDAPLDRIAHPRSLEDEISWEIEVTADGR